MIFFVLFENGRSPNVAATLTKFMKLDVEKDNVALTLLTLFISTLEYKTSIRHCSTLQTPTLKYTTLFRRCFDVVSRHDVISTKKQRWNVYWDYSRLNICQMFLLLETLLYLYFPNFCLIYIKERERWMWLSHGNFSLSQILAEPFS